MNTWTFRARVAVLRKILNDDSAPDYLKLVCAQEKIENFIDEDELLNRLQSLEIKDDPPPGSPEERGRHDEIQMLIAQALMTRTLLYSEVTAVPNKLPFGQGPVKGKQSSRLDRCR